jgi:hypothetical protein
MELKDTGFARGGLELPVSRKGQLTSFTDRIFGFPKNREFLVWLKN